MRKNGGHAPKAPDSCSVEDVIRARLIPNEKRDVVRAEEWRVQGAIKTGHAGGEGGSSRLRIRREGDCLVVIRQRVGVGDYKTQGFKSASYSAILEVEVKFKYKKRSLYL